MVDPERPRLGRFHKKLAELIPCNPEDARVDLHKMEPRELVGCYVNWADRYVAPRPRRVVTWDGFLRHGSPQPHLEAMHDLAKKIEAGDDFKSLLSDRHDPFGCSPPTTDNNTRAAVVVVGAPLTPCNT